MTSKSVENRPMKFGEKNRRELIVQDSEVSLITINDTSGNPTYLGRAKAGTLTSEPKWQIRKVTYDSTNSVTRVQWPENDQGLTSTDYEFIWGSNSALTITDITNANPAVVTVSDVGQLENGDQIVIQNVGGMTQVNFDGSNIYTVANLSAGPGTFELQGTNSSAYGTYTSGGSVEYGEVVNYTYS